jgi:hypothetical protein
MVVKQKTDTRGRCVSKGSSPTQILVAVSAGTYSKAAAFGERHNLNVESVMKTAIDLLVLALEKDTCENVVQQLERSARQSRSGRASVVPISKTLDVMQRKGALPSRR